MTSHVRAAMPATLLAVTGAIFSLSPNLLADELHVPGEYASIQLAINAASDGDSVVVAEGTYYEAIDFLGKRISVIGKGPELTTIDAAAYDESVVRMMYPCGFESTIEGFTLTGGTGSFLGNGRRGGGILIGSCNATLRNLVIDGNTAEAGGGVSAWMSNVQVEDCRISDNSASSSGTFGGSGLYAYGSWISLRGVMISDNYGAVFSGGGGIMAYSSEITGSDVAIVGNAGRYSGGIYLFNAIATLANATISQNEATNMSDGHAIGQWGNGGFDITNSVIWDNGPESPQELRHHADAAVTVSHSIVRGGYEGTNVLDVDPMFQENCYRLTMDSPAVGAGLNSAVETDTDLDGNPRVADPMNAETLPVVDMGAYELQPAAEPDEPEPCLGDADGNATVNLADLLTVIAGWGGCSDCGSCDGDLNADCVISLPDLLEVIANWGNTCESP